MMMILQTVSWTITRNVDGSTMTTSITHLRGPIGQERPAMAPATALLRSRATILVALAVTAQTASAGPQRGGVHGGSGSLHQGDAAGHQRHHACVHEQPNHGVSAVMRGTSLAEGVEGVDYAGAGGGIKIGFDAEEFSFCGEIGLGLGAGVVVDPAEPIDGDSTSVMAEISAEKGPLGGSVKAELDDCGRASVEGKACFGPFCAKAKKTFGKDGLEKGGEVSGSWPPRPCHGYAQRGDQGGEYQTAGQARRPAVCATQVVGGPRP